MAQGRLAQLQVETVFEQTLDVRSRDGARTRTVEQLPQARARLFQRGHALLGAFHGLLGQREGALRVLLGEAEGHQAARPAIPQEHLVNGQLHDVTDLPQRAPREARQPKAGQGPGAGVAPACEDHLAGPGRVEARGEPRPQVRGVGVHGAANVHEVVLPSSQPHAVLAALLYDNPEKRTFRTESAHAVRVDPGHGLGVD
mmetsp:Transcript_69216/g.212223  ORF Transcript_69216/g.212223 Transcript_69216/m.212223 type:complete len:200 (-) Transcript_69216:242-841(-)